MTLSVIIVNWRVRDLLRACLESIVSGTTMPPSDWEIIVVDNDSRDGSVEMVREMFPGVRLVENAGNVGFGAANNQALPLARGRYLLLLNPDTSAPPGALDHLVAEMDARPDAGAIGCRLLNSDGSYQTRSAGYEPSVWSVSSHFLFLDRLLPSSLRPRPIYALSEPSAPASMGWVSGACILLRRAALNKRLFDERYFMYWEDVELCSRLRRSGWEIVYVPSIEIVHHEGRSFGEASAEIQVHKVRSMRRYLHNRYSGLARLTCDCSIVAGFLLRTLVLTAGAVVRGGPALRERRRLTLQFLREAVRGFRSEPGR